jgi:N-carbamoylputrescine amidase
MYIPFKVAGVQMACKIGDVKGNVEKACNMIERATKEGARLVCLPEMFNTGLFPRPKHLDPKYWDLAEPLEDSWTLARIGASAKKHDLYIVAPFVEKAGHGIYHNSAALIDTEGEIVGCYRKVHLSWSLTAWEKFYFRSGYDFPVYQTPFAKLGIQICYDRDFPEGFRTLALKGAELILLSAGAPRNLAQLWRDICRVRAYENGFFVLGVGLTGKVDEEHQGFAGNSILASPRGEILAALDYQEGILIAEVDLRAIEEARRLRFGLRDRRPEMYGKLTEMV